MVNARLSLFFLLFLLLSNCDNERPELTEGPVSTGQEEAINGLFQWQEPEETGVTFINKIENTLAMNCFNFPYLLNGGGVAVLDFDADGQLDLFFVSNQAANKLYRNEGNWKFRDVTEQAGVAAPDGYTAGVSIVDINADKLPDIYLCRTGIQQGAALVDRRNLLFVNGGDGTFTEQAATYGLQSDRATVQANFFDYDGDGDLDCYLQNTPVDFAAVNEIRARQTPQGIQRIKEPKELFESDQLLRNDNGQFTDVSRAAGIHNYSFALSTLVHDFNGDQRPDIYVANDYVAADNLYINNGDGTFSDQLEKYFSHTSHNSMGSDLGDINNDGLPEVMVLDMLAQDLVRQKSLETNMRPDRYNALVSIGYGHQLMRNVLQLNTGREFVDVAPLAGIAATDWSWTPLLADFDNDRKVDVFVSNGYRYDVTDIDFTTFTSDSAQAIGLLDGVSNDKLQTFIGLIPSEPLPNYLYRNRGDLTFADVSKAWGVGTRNTYSSSAVYADLDKDGDLDLVVSNFEEPPHLYRNQAIESGQGGNWLQIEAKGAAENPAAYGLTATAYVGTETLVRQLTPIRGFLGTVDPTLHFGLGDADVIDRLEVRWPDGKTSVETNVPVNQRLILEHAGATAAPFPGAAAGARWFTYPADQRGLRFLHRENKHADFDQQFLLPRMHSREGPAVATADLNQDGLEDIFLGGGSNQPATIFLQKKDGTFALSPHQLPAPDAGYEDVEALFFDADGDQDPDLFVGSGGTYSAPGSPRYQGRLYLNDAGQFRRANFPATPTSTGAVATVDFDNDGDLDLLIGGRVTPGAYPQAPPSYLLENNGGQFSDVTQRVFPDLQQLGMITAIAVGDVEGDAQPEIIVAGEWMPLSIYTKSGDSYVLSSTSPTTASGIWRSLLLVDLDGDGQREIVAGNEGLNSRFQPTPAQPVKMYAADFDGNGRVDPIVTVADPAGKLVPLTAKALFLKQLPGLKKKFVRTRAYARAGIEDIFTPAELEKASVFTLNTLASAVFKRNGKEWQSTALPNSAQLAPARSIQSHDVNGDGLPDLLLVGNDYGAQVETGRMDAGTGTLLLNDGKGGWQETSNRDHGFWATQDARKLIGIPLATGERGWLVANNNDSVALFLEQ